MKNDKLHIFLKYSKFWSISLELLIEQKPEEFYAMRKSEGCFHGKSRKIATACLPVGICDELAADVVWSVNPADVCWPANSAPLAALPE